MSDAAELEPADDLGEPEVEPEAPAAEKLSRDRDLLGGARQNSPIRKKLAELVEAVRKGFQEQSERSDAQGDYWDCYNCRLNSQQFYNGNSGIYVPIVRDAINARATRFVNQLFPQSGHYVEAIAADGSSQNELVALLDHYIREARFKTNVAKPLSRNGDVEGHYNVYCDWTEAERQVVSRETHGPRDPLTGAEMPGEPIEDVSEEDVIEGRPAFEVLHDCDVLVLPASADSIEDALQSGGSVTIVRRWSKAKIEAMIAEDAIRSEEGDDLTETMGKVTQDGQDIEKSLAEDIGITKKGKEAVVWETWAMLKLGDKGYSEKGTRRLCRVFFGPSDTALGCKRNPHWNDRCPLLSVPVEKIAGVFKGKSLVEPIASMQYEANDAINEGADAAAYSALPIVARDPEMGNGPMILNLAAIWDIKPESVKFLTFPDLTPRAITRVQMATQGIFQSLGVNPAMMPQQTGRPGAKRNQAEVAMEQSVDLLTTAEAVSVLEEGIFTPACAWMVDLDYQFRDDEITVRMYGEMGHKAEMQKVAPLQNRNGFAFVWRGSEQAKMNAMMLQQGTAALNVARGLAPQLAAEGVQLKLAPIVERWISQIFGPVLGARVIVDQRDQLTLDPEGENEMMSDGFEVPIHPLDDDNQHLPSHMRDMQEGGDPHGTKRVHVQMHLRQKQAKAQAAAMMQMRQMMQQQGGGQSGGGQGGPGMPQPGAAPAGPRLLKQAPGAVHHDQMPRAGAVPMPRRM